MALAVPQNQRSGARGQGSSSRSSSRCTSTSTRSRRRSSPRRSTRQLAEEGAILFHEKDLWEDSRNQSIPKVGGNGSCASCHGVYSPRYAHDTKFLPDPRLKGIEAQITPIETIQTDPARTRLVNEQFKRAWDTSWWGYDDLNPAWTPEGQGRAGTTFERLRQRLRRPARPSQGPEPVEQRADRLRGAAALRRVGVGAVLPQRQRPDDRRRAAAEQAPRHLATPAHQARREGGISQGVDSSSRRLRLRPPRLQVHAGRVRPGRRPDPDDPVQPARARR